MKTVGLPELIGSIGTIGLIITLGIIILLFISRWIIFTKAGKPGWACLIPIYDSIIYLDIIGKSYWWILWLMIPGVNIIFIIWSVNLLSKSFGKGVGFTLGLLFFSYIFFPILAFSDYKYEGPAGLKQ